MPKYLDSDGVSYLWSKIKNISNNKLSYYSKTKEEWNSNPNLLSEKDVLYIYTNYKIVVNQNNEDIFIPGLKLGDGKTYLIDLPFINSDSNFEEILMDHINNKIIHVSLEDRLFWDNKLNFSLQQLDQNLIFNRN